MWNSEIVGLSEVGLVELWLWKYHYWTEAIADHLAFRSVVPAAKMSLITWEDLKPGFVTEPKEKSVFSLENRNFLFSPSEAILPSQRLTPNPPEAISILGSPTEEWTITWVKRWKLWAIKCHMVPTLTWTVPRQGTILKVPGAPSFWM